MTSCNCTVIFRLDLFMVTWTTLRCLVLFWALTRGLLNYVMTRLQPYLAYLWIRQFSTLQACHVTAQPELLTVEALQILFPLNNLIVDLLFCFRIWHYTLLQVCHVLQLVVLYMTAKDTMCRHMNTKRSCHMLHFTAELQDTSLIKC